MKEENDFRPNIIDFVHILIQEINNKNVNLSNHDKTLIINKLYELYEEGWWDTETNTTIQSSIYEFIQGYSLHKTWGDIE